MILLLSNSFTSSTDDVACILHKRNLPFFRFNTDLYDHYQFLWQGDTFEIIDPCNRICNSKDVTICAMYKCIQWCPPTKQFAKHVENPKYITYILNELCGCIANWAIQKKILRLWHPMEYFYPKTKQMNIAKKYFSVPQFSLHWGFSLSSRNVVSKQIIQRPLDDGGLPFAEIVDRARLDPHYPWFTQEIATGDRDATVLYINGKVHCFQFATERGQITDWRITQGTDVNKWIPWNSGDDFKQRIDLFMKELNLKFGRLDFIIGGKEPQFLEVNPRGQFGWLDDEKLTLHNEVVDAILDPRTTIAI